MNVISPFMERIEASSRNWKVADSIVSNSQIGALMNAGHRSKVRRVSNERDKGEDAFVSTVIYKIGKDDPMAEDEISGPVLSVIEVVTNDEAAMVANQTEYGSAASIFKANTGMVIRAVRDVKAGPVMVNCHGGGDILTPFGGCKQSGFDGRDNGFHAYNQFTELKINWIELTDPNDGDNV